MEPPKSGRRGELEGLTRGHPLLEFAARAGQDPAETPFPFPVANPDSRWD